MTGLSTPGPSLLPVSTNLTTEPTDPHPSSPDDKLDKGVFIIAGVVVLGAIMSILDITVVSVALNTFQREFDATSAEVAWTMTGHTLALAAVIPLTGWAADRFGTKRLYMLAVLLFTLGSALCALAPNLEMLVLFRVLQGLGGGMLMPALQQAMARLQQLARTALPQLSEAYASVFLVGTILVGLCFVPAFFLPQKKVEPIDPALMVGH